MADLKKPDLDVYMKTGTCRKNLASYEGVGNSHLFNFSNQRPVTSDVDLDTQPTNSVGSSADISDERTTLSFKNDKDFYWIGKVQSRLVVPIQFIEFPQIEWFRRAHDPGGMHKSLRGKVALSPWNPNELSFRIKIYGILLKKIHVVHIDIGQVETDISGYARDGKPPIKASESDVKKWLRKTRFSVIHQDRSPKYQRRADVKGPPPSPVENTISPYKDKNYFQWFGKVPTDLFDPRRAFEF